MKVWKLLLLLFLALICSCGKENKNRKIHPANTNWLFMLLMNFVNQVWSILLFRIFKKHNCQLEVILFRNTADLSKAVKSRANYGKYDLAIGIDNSFVMSETLAVNFVPPESFDTDLLIKETVFDPSLRLIPYAYSNLSLVYNTSLVKILLNPLANCKMRNIFLK